MRAKGHAGVARTRTPPCDPSPLPSIPFCQEAANKVDPPGGGETDAEPGKAPGTLQTSRSRENKVSGPDR